MSRTKFCLRPFCTASRCATLWLALSLYLLAGPCMAQKLTIYTENWPPLNYANDGKIEGMAVEIVHALQARLGKNNPIVLVPWARGYRAVQDEPNVLLFSIGRSPEREKLMYMLGPIAISSTVLYTRKGNAARMLALGEELYTLPVGAYRSSIFADTAKKKGFIHIDQASTPQISAKMLLAKRFDLWVEGSLAVASILKETGHSVDEVEKVMVLDSLELFLAFSPRTSAATVKAWEGALRWLKKTGGFQKIHQKWLPNEAPPMQVLLLKPAAPR